MGSEKALRIIITQTAIKAERRDTKVPLMDKKRNAKTGF